MYRGRLYAVACSECCVCIGVQYMLRRGVSAVFVYKDEVHTEACSEYCVCIGMQYIRTEACS